MVACRWRIDRVVREVVVRVDCFTRSQVAPDVTAGPTNISGSVRVHFPDGSRKRCLLQLLALSSCVTAWI